MLKKLNNYAFETAIYEILRDNISIDKINPVEKNGEYFIVYRKNDKEETSYSYNDCDSMISDFKNYELLFNKLHSRVCESKTEGWIKEKR